METGAVQDTGSCMLPKLGNAIPLLITVRKWAGSLLTSGLLNVKEVCLTNWIFHLIKFYPFQSKILSEDESCHYCGNKLIG